MDDFLLRLNRKVRDEHIPISGSLDVTEACNLRCVHCYIRRESPRVPSQWNPRRVDGLFGEMADAGCLFLLLTGGEPLIDSGFPGLYTQARRRGFVTTVFTNATCVDDRILDLWRDLPPGLVEVTIYGATAPVYERVTGVQGSFRAAMTGLDRLQSLGIPLRLKTVLLSCNADELPAMEALAKSRDLRFRMDAAVFARLDGSQDPLALRVDPRLAARMELRDPARVANWKAYLDRVGTLKPSTLLYRCGAGVNSFHLTARCELVPCMLARTPMRDVSAGGFAAAWRELTDEVSHLHGSASHKCSTCRLRVVCGICPAAARLEHGNPEAPSEYLCKLGEERLFLLSQDRESAVP
jgi:radical SAM protein with 4Fe4S-binding SPASM domain